MNTTIAKLIAFELGILIAILSWMAFTRSPAQKRSSAEASEEPLAQSFAAVSPLSETKPRAVPAVDYLADNPSPELVESQPDESFQTYQPQLATGPYDDYSYYDYGFPAAAPNYIGTYPEPVLGPEYYGWPYGGLVTYAPATQIAVIRSPRSCRRAVTPPRRAVRPRMSVPSRHSRLQPPLSRVGQRVTRRFPAGPRVSPSRQPVRSRPAASRQTARVAWNR